MINSHTSLNRLVETLQTGLAARNDKQNELHLHFTLPDVTFLPFRLRIVSFVSLG